MDDTEEVKETQDSLEIEEEEAQGGQAPFFFHIPAGSLIGGPLSLSHFCV